MIKTKYILPFSLLLSILFTVGATYPPYSYPPKIAARLHYEEIRVYTEEELTMMTKLLWGEGRGLSDEELALIIWCVLQRVESEDFDNTIAEVIIAPNQFYGYKEHFPVNEDMYNLVIIEIEKWTHGEEPPLLEPYAVELPYLYFNAGKSKEGTYHNFFRKDYR